MPRTSQGCAFQQRAFSIFSKVINVTTLRRIADKDLKSPATTTTTTTTSQERRARSRYEIAFESAEILDEVRRPASNVQKTDTVLYLAYGSNLSAETFQGVRGIQPLSQINVLVPELELTFDLPGIPYTEPCFANTRYRTPSPEENFVVGNDYHKDRWHKGLVGVVYEVTKADYAKIIATEGGGSGYQDVVVNCHEIPAGTKVIDPDPTSTPFKAHTLFAPYSPPSKPALPPKGGRGRCDPSYAQASARYLKLITDGAEEHDLPKEYRDFLYDVRPYTMTSAKQKVGQAILLSIWLPFIQAILTLGAKLADDNGRMPPWLAILANWAFAGMWLSYDTAFKPCFGDGERTQKGQDDEVEEGRVCPEKQPLTERSLE